MVFWPHGTGRSAHREMRQTARERCRAMSAPAHLLEQPASVIRLLERPHGSARQFEERAALMRTLRSAHPSTGAGARRHVVVQVVRMVAAVERNGSGLALGSRVCDQLAWFSGAAVVVTPHGAANALAPFADPSALVVEAPYDATPIISDPTTPTRTLHQPSPGVVVVLVVVVVVVVVLVVVVTLRPA